ncbi:MAG: hypothetical protein RSD76_03705 [Clostridia bacterium]
MSLVIFFEKSNQKERQLIALCLFARRFGYCQSTAPKGKPNGAVVRPTNAPHVKK